MTKRAFLKICREQNPPVDPKTVRDWRRYIHGWEQVKKRFEK